MLPADRDYHIVWDRIANRPYLAWKQDNEFWSLFMNEYKIDRVIFSSVPVIFPTFKNTHGWILSYKEKPFVEDMDEVSPDVLTFDSQRNFVCECFYTFGMSGSEWCDSESMGPYDKTIFNPNYWKPLPTIEEMESLVKEY